MLKAKKAEEKSRVHSQIAELKAGLPELKKIYPVYSVGKETFKGRYPPKRCRRESTPIVLRRELC